MNRLPRAKWLIILLLWAAAPCSVQATERTQPTAPTAKPEAAKPEAAKPEAAKSEPAKLEAPKPEPIALVQRFKVVGSTVFQPWELDNVTQPFEAQPLTIETLQKAADAVTRYYLDHGYLTSRAVLGNQTLENGAATIQVVEGSLESLTIKGTRRVGQDYVRDRIAQAGLNPLNQENLEYQLRLLRGDPLFSNIEATLQEGSQAGQSVLALTVRESPTITGLASLDNYGIKAVGAQQLGFAVGSRNLTGKGDALVLNVARSATGGNSSLQLSYQYPLNPSQGMLTLRVANTGYRVTLPELAELGITGKSRLYEVGLRQPIARSVQSEVALSVGVMHRSGSALVGDILTASSETTRLRFGQDWLKRDSVGYWIANSQFDVGRFTGDQTGNFMAWSGDFQRVRSLGKNQQLITHLGWQLSPDTVPATQKFNLGGPQTLRGLPSGVINGDNGIAFSIEDRLTVMRKKSGAALLQLSPYLELGTVWNQASLVQSEPLGLLGTAGLGINWQPTSNWSMRMDVAMPVWGSVNGGMNFYLSTNYRF
jgi:hemolysin activation/secretion protein